jgi:hypothetical protein
MIEGGSKAARYRHGWTLQVHLWRSPQELMRKSQED